MRNWIFSPLSYKSKPNVICQLSFKRIKKKKGVLFDTNKIEKKIADCIVISKILFLDVVLTYDVHIDIIQTFNFPENEDRY